MALHLVPPSSDTAAQLTDAAAIRDQAFALWQNGDATPADRAQVAADAMAVHARAARSIAQALTDLRAAMEAETFALAAVHRLTLAPGQSPRGALVDRVIPPPLIETALRGIADSGVLTRTAA